mgnify:CR=1 FL=1
MVKAGFHLEQHSVYPSTNVEDVYTKMMGNILKAFDAYTKKGLGWILNAVIKLDITLSKLNPLRGCSYLVLP